MEGRRLEHPADEEDEKGAERVDARVVVGELIEVVRHAVDALHRGDEGEAEDGASVIQGGEAVGRLCARVWVVARTATDAASALGALSGLCLASDHRHGRR